MTELPRTMTAIEIADGGGPPEVLKAVQRPVPTPAAGELLVKVAAAGVNRPDVAQRQGTYPPPPGASDIPGLEIAGTVAALGADAGGWSMGGWSVGDAVCGLVTGGGYAQYCALPAPQALPVPAGLDMVAAAALPETFFTVWANVYDRGRLKAGETLLVHGGSSGIGTTAIQMAKALGSTVFATAGSDAKCRACEELGAARAINYKRQDFVAAIKQLTEGAGVDVILDMVCGDYVERNLRSLAVEGRLCVIALLGGAKVEANFATLLRRRLTITGSTLRPRTVAEKGAIARALREEVWPRIGEGLIKPVIDTTYALADAAKAHARMESSAHIGKLILGINTPAA